MNTPFAAAAGLTFLIGLVHSVLGERLVFTRLRQGTLVPTLGGTLLRAPHVRILWATWHVVTLLGWAIGAVLLLLAAEPALGRLHIALLQVLALGLLASAALVALGTRGRHPGWIGLGAVAVLIGLGLRA